MDRKKIEEQTRQERVYFILKDLGKRLGEVVFGSVAFDVELGETRYKINRLIDESLSQHSHSIIQKGLLKVLIYRNSKKSPNTIHEDAERHFAYGFLHALSVMEKAFGIKLSDISTRNSNRFKDLPNLDWRKDGRTIQDIDTLLSEEEKI